jgi:hypothetical protein
MYFAYALSHCRCVGYQSVEHFKAAYDNKAFTLSHCWMVIKDSKKWESILAQLS